MLTDAGKPELLQTWTTQRIIGLGTRGPVIVDLSVNVGGRSLEEVARATIDNVAEQVAADLKKPWSWTDLLEHRLIKSGWLGNLMPQPDQRDQLIGMYDKDGDEEVDDEELSAFLTRGLARGATLRFTTAASTSDSMLVSSPWGPWDVNVDNQLDSSELQSVAENASHYDINGDHVVTRAELVEMQASDVNSTATSPSPNSQAMFEPATAIPVSPDQKPAQFGDQLLKQYTFLSSVQRDQWSGWSEASWKELDIDGDRQLTNSELAKLGQAQPHLELRVMFPAPGKQVLGKLTAMVNASSTLSWESRIGDTGHAHRKDFTLTVAMVDNYSVSMRQALHTQLSAALNNPQIEALIRNQLQLGEEAFQVLDANADKQLSDEEFERVWGWVTGIRGARAIARWSIPASVWCELADHDGDNSVT